MSEEGFPRILCYCATTEADPKGKLPYGFLLHMVFSWEIAGAKELAGEKSFLPDMSLRCWDQLLSSHWNNNPGIQDSLCEPVTPLLTFAGVAVSL